MEILRPTFNRWRTLALLAKRSSTGRRDAKTRGRFYVLCNDTNLTRRGRKERCVRACVSEIVTMVHVYSVYGELQLV